MTHPIRRPRAVFSLALLRGSAIAAFATLQAVLLAACDHDHGWGNDHRLATLSDAEARNPITVVEQHPRLDIPFGVLWSDPTGSAKLEVARFLHQYKRTGSGKLTISTSRGRHEIEMRRWIRATGIADSAVVFVAHPLYDDMVRLAYTRLAATTQPCGDWSENVDLNRDNLPYKNFGCAVQSNLAVMIARPTDVLYPAPETPRGAERRSFDQKKYSEGALGTDTKSGISAR